MKATKNVFWVSMGFGAWMVIAISGDTLRDRQAGLVGGSGNLYLVWLLAAVVFMHWLLWSRFVLFIKINLRPEHWQRIQAQASQMDFTGPWASLGKPRELIALGYFISLMGYVFLWFTRSLPVPTGNPLWFGLGFIGLGLLAKTLNVIRALKLELSQ